MTFPALLIFHTQSLKSYFYEMNFYFSKANWPGGWGNINDLHHNTTPPAYDNLFALIVTKQSNFAIEMDNLNLWTVDKSVARAKTRRLSEIFADKVVSYHLNFIWNGRNTSKWQYIF